MEFNKVKEAIEGRNFALKYFIPKVSGMTGDGFRLACARGTLKVSVLEKITKALGLKMTYWWEDEDLISSVNKDVEKDTLILNQKQEIQRQNKTIDHLNFLLDQMRKTESDGKGKAVQCG